MALSYLFDPNKQFQDKNGVNNVGGYLYVFINDSDDNAPTYCNFTGTLNPERIVLDNNGRAVVIVDELKTYRIEVYDRSGNMLWSQYPVRPTNIIYGDYNVYNADIYGTTDEIDVDVEMYASGVKKFTIKLANAVKTVLGNIQDTISSIVETVSTKADKVQGATSGNFAALDANGNLTDSGKKAADFATDAHLAAETARAQAAEAAAKTEVVQGENCTIEKTTAADGHDVYTVNADGKPQVQIFEAPYSNGATVWPSGRDVKAAFFAGKTPVIRYQEGPVANYDEYLFMSYTSGSGYYEMKFSYKDKLLTYNSTSNVWGVTNAYSSSITSGDTNAPQGGAVNYALAGKVDTTGDASNTTSTFTKSSGDASSMTSGGKLSAIFTAISSFFASLKALAFKATVGTGDIDNDAITAAKVKDNETLPVNISGNAASATNLAPGGTSGQYLKSNGSGNAPSWDDTSNLIAGIANNMPFGYVVLSNTPSSGDAPANAGILCEIVPDLTGNSGYFAELDVFVVQINRVYAHCKVRMFMRCQSGNINYRSWVIWEKPNPTNISVTVRRSTSSKKFFLCAKGASGTYAGCYAVLRSASDMYANVSRSLPDWVKMYPNAALENIDYLIDDTTESNKVGTTSKPVYVDTDGTVKPCGFQINFGTPIAGSDVLNIITA